MDFVVIRWPVSSPHFTIDLPRHLSYAQIVGGQTPDSVVELMGCLTWQGFRLLHQTQSDGHVVYTFGRELD